MLDRLAEKCVRPTVWLAGAVFLLTLLPYIQTGGYDFVNLDDTQYIHLCPQVTGGLSLRSIVQAFGSFTYGAIWMPLTWISYMADVSLWGLHAGAMHLHNAFLHASNAVLLFVLLGMMLERVAGYGLRVGDVNGTQFAVRDEKGGGIQRVSGRLAEAFPPLIAAALSALFWSLHPLRVEPVAWIASRKDVLSLFWELLALIFWVKQSVIGGRELKIERATSGDRATQRNEAIRESTSLFRFLSIACFALAGMAKPTAMTFPALAALMELLVAGRVRFSSLAWPFVGAVGLAAIATYSQTAGGAKEVLAHVPMYGRMGNAIAAIGTYCWKTVWPTGLAVSYVHKWPDLPVFFWPGLAICAGYGVALLWSSLRSGALNAVIVTLPITLRNRISTGISRPPNADWQPPTVVFVGLAWFLIAVAPMLGLSNFGYHSHADRFTYLPAIGLSLILAFGLTHVRLNLQRVVVTGVTLLLCAWLGLAWNQTRYWENEKTLFSHALTVDPKKNYIAFRNLGIYYYGIEHDCKKAVEFLGASFKINRERNRFIQRYYIFALAESNELELAKRETQDLTEWKNGGGTREITDKNMQKSFNIQFSEFDTLLAYAMLAYCEGDKDLAVRHIKCVLNRDPKQEDAHYILGLIAWNEHRSKDALDHWRISIEGGPTTLRHFLKARLVK